MTPPRIPGCVHGLTMVIQRSTMYIHHTPTTKWQIPSRLLYVNIMARDSGWYHWLNIVTAKWQIPQRYVFTNISQGFRWENWPNITSLFSSVQNCEQAGFEPKLTPGCTCLCGQWLSVSKLKQQKHYILQYITDVVAAFIFIFRLFPLFLPGDLLVEHFLSLDGYAHVLYLWRKPCCH